MTQKFDTAAKDQTSQTHSITRVVIEQANTDKTAEHLDNIVVEEPLEIWVKQFKDIDSSETLHLSTTMRTPGQDIELVRGWLHSLNLLAMDDILDIKFTGSDTLKQQPSNRVLVTLKPGVRRNWEKVQHNDFTHSSCGVCGQQSVEWLLEEIPPICSSNSFSVPTAAVHTLLTAFTAIQANFHRTGGCHGVGLFDASLTILDCQEDVGRHNAMDKLIGNNLDILPGPFGVVLSGRVSFEMVQKAARAGISMIVSVGAPTSLAVSLCDEFDIGLAGFVKPEKYNIYTGAPRFV